MKKRRERNDDDQRDKADKTGNDDRVLSFDQVLLFPKNNGDLIECTQHKQQTFGGYFRPICGKS